MIQVSILTLVKCFSKHLAGFLFPLCVLQYGRSFSCVCGTATGETWGRTTPLLPWLHASLERWRLRWFSDLHAQMHRFSYTCSRHLSWHFLMTHSTADRSVSTLKETQGKPYNCQKEEVKTRQSVVINCGHFHLGGWSEKNVSSVDCGVLTCVSVSVSASAR